MGVVLTNTQAKYLVVSNEEKTEQQGGRLVKDIEVEVKENRFYFEHEVQIHIESESS